MQVLQRIGIVLYAHKLPPLLPACTQVMNKLIRRYKYLQKALDEEMRKILRFLKAFSEDERRSLAIFTGLCLANTLVNAGVLSSLIT